MPQKNISGLSDSKKAAILMMSLPEGQASKIMAHLGKEGAQQLARQIAGLGKVAAEERDAVFEEFYELNMARRYLSEGGIEHARSLLEASSGKERAARILKSARDSLASGPFGFLQESESENLINFLQDEHPQTLALILSHLGSSYAGRLLSGLPLEKQIEVIRRIAHMQHANPEVVKEIERSLEKRFSAIVSRKFEKAGGIERAAEILNQINRAAEKSILENLEEDEPETAEQIRRLMFSFENIILVNDRGIQAVLKEIEREDLALALKTASENLKEKIFGNMSERASMLIKEEMEYMGPVRIREVEAAQQKIVDAVRRLEDAGQLIITGREGEEEVVA